MRWAKIAIVCVFDGRAELLRCAERVKLSVQKLVSFTFDALALLGSVAVLAHTQAAVTILQPFAPRMRAAVAILQIHRHHRGTPSKWNISLPL